jgi:hypothetical protein
MALVAPCMCLSLLDVLVMVVCLLVRTYYPGDKSAGCNVWLVVTTPAPDIAGTIPPLLDDPSVNVLVLIPVQGTVIRFNRASHPTASQ